MGERLALLDGRDGRVHLLSPAASVVWQHADGRTGPDELARRVAASTGEPDGTAVAMVAQAFDDLEAAGLLAQRSRGVPRRQVLTAAGLAVVAPMVSSVGSAAAKGPVDKVAVCHRGRTIMVRPSSVADHLAHGDFLGSCDAPATSTTQSNTTTTTTDPNTTTTTTDPNTTTTTTDPNTTTTTTTTTAANTTTTSTTPRNTTTSTTAMNTTTSTTAINPTTTSTTSTTPSLA